MKVNAQNIILIIKENWKDPVWSKVIATTIITVTGLILTTLYSIVKSLITKSSFTETFNDLIVFFNKTVEIKMWLPVLLFIIYIILISNQIIVLIKNVIMKVKNSQSITKKINEKGKPIATEQSTSFFYQRMASAFPGIREVTWFENPKEATDRLEILLQEPLIFKSNTGKGEVDPVWWFRGNSALFINKFVRTGKRKVIMNISQLKIRRIAAYHGNEYYKDFVYVEVDGEKQTGIYNMKEEEIQRCIKRFGYCWEEYGLIKNIFWWKTPIRREDYDDGATIIRGKVRDAKNAELRVRYITKYNFIIAAKGSPYNSNKFEKKSKEYLNDILSGKIEPNDFFQFLKEFQKYER